MSILTEQTVLVTALIFSIYALSLHITLKAGLFALANAGFGAIGAYTAADLLVRYSVTPILATLAAVAVSVLVAFVVVLPFLRVRGIYLALLTFSFGELVLALVKNGGDLTKGTVGLNVPRTVGAPDLIVVVVIIVVAVARLERSRVGKAMDAIRLNEDMAEAMGIPVRRTLIGAFVLSSALAGTAGALWAQQTYYIAPDDFGFLLVVKILLYTVVGGAFVWYGPVIGAFFMTYVSEFMTPLGDLRQILLGLVLVGVVVLRPDGLSQLLGIRRGCPPGRPPTNGFRRRRVESVRAGAARVVKDS